MKFLILILFSSILVSCSLLIHERHKVQALSQKNMDAFDDFSKGKVEKCFKKKNLGDEEFFATHVVVKVDSKGLMTALSYYPKVKEFDYDCLKQLTESFTLKDSSDFNSERRLKIVQYK